MRPIRHARPAHMVEVTTRTINRTKLLRPSKRVNDIIAGVVCHAKKQTGVEVYAFVFMSTHYHLLLGVTDAKQQSNFMRLLNGNITVKLNDLNRRTGAGWARRFQAIPVSNDRATQERRLRYLLAHGVKERLVARCRDWPGFSGLPWLLDGKTIRGVWTSFTDRYHAQRRVGYVPTPGEFDTVYVLEMSVLPCWRQLSAPAWRARVAELVAEIEAEEAERCLEETGRTLEERVIGVDAVLAAEPSDRLPWQKRTRAPSVHAASNQEYQRWCWELALLREVYQAASERFRAGERDVPFPLGTFRPLGGFVETPLARLTGPSANGGPVRVRQPLALPR